MIAVAVQFDEETIPTVAGTNEINVTVSFPRVDVVAGDGVEVLESYGNGTNSITKTELIGKEVLLLTTDGRSRSRLKNEFTFTTGTGATTFPSIIQSTQVIQWLYK